MAYQSSARLAGARQNLPGLTRAYQSQGLPSLAGLSRANQVARRAHQDLARLSKDDQCLTRTAKACQGLPGLSKDQQRSAVFKAAQGLAGQSEAAEAGQGSARASRDLPSVAEFSQASQAESKAYLSFAGLTEARQ
eukprot:7469284-Pyramimonas_sp.AAC.1